MIITITGPSGSGKTTLLNKLVSEYPEEIFPIVSTTTREKRKKEKDGVDYHFVDKDKFRTDQMLEFDKFGENYYGLSQEEVDKVLKRDPNSINIAILDPNGAKALKACFDDDFIYSVYILVSPEQANYYLKRRDGKKVAEKRLTVDHEAGLYNPIGYDCVIANCGTMDDLCHEFMNFI